MKRSDLKQLIKEQILRELGDTKSASTLRSKGDVVAADEANDRMTGGGKKLGRQYNEREIPQTIDAGVLSAIKASASNITYYVREMGLSFDAAVTRAKDHSTLGSSSWQKVVELAKSKLGSALSELDDTKSAKMLRSKGQTVAAGEANDRKVRKPGEVWLIANDGRHSGSYGAKNKSGTIRYASVKQYGSALNALAVAKKHASSIDESSLRETIRDIIRTMLNEASFMSAATMAAASKRDTARRKKNAELQSTTPTTPKSNISMSKNCRCLNKKTGKYNPECAACYGSGYSEPSE